MRSDLDIGKAVVKVWGKEIWVANSPWYCSKKLIVRPGYRCSVHRHLKKNEAFFVEKGHGWAMVGEEPIELLPGVVVDVPAGVWHQFWCPADSERLVMAEISSHHSDEDVERSSPSGPLVQPPVVMMDELG